MKLTVKDKGVSYVKGGGANYSVYECEGWAITFADIYDKDTGYHFMTDWELSSKDESYVGNNINDLLPILNYIGKDLQVYSNNKKDCLIIYTNRLRDLYCYLYNYVTNTFLIDKLEKNIGYFQIGLIEFRQCFNKECKTTEDIVNWANNMWEYCFIPNNKVFITESAVSRYFIKESCREHKESLGKDIFPKNYAVYQYYKRSAHGGICYCAYPNEDLNNLIAVDLKSAYIYCYTLPMPITEGECIDPTLWHKTKKLTIGTYTITYSNTSDVVSTIRDKNDVAMSTTGEIVTQTFVLNNVDRDTIFEIIKVIDVECTELWSFESDRLPKAYIDVLLKCFAMKETTTGGERKVWKIALNGIYGNSLRNLTIKEFKNYNHKELVPQWGSFITAYCRKMVWSLGKTLKGWAYSDTDCIFCDNIDDNIKKINKFNKKTQATVKVLCDEYGYKYDDIKELGSFIVEDEIIRFRAIGHKQYAYKTKNDKVIVKAAGCERQENYDDSVFELEHMPIGNKQMEYALVTEPQQFGDLYAETTYTAIYTDNPDNFKALIFVREMRKT